MFVFEHRSDGFYSISLANDINSLLPLKTRVSGAETSFFYQTDDFTISFDMCPGLYLQSARSSCFSNR